MVMKTILIISVTLSFLLGCNSHTHYHEAQLYISDTVSVFINNDICKNHQDCINKKLVKFEAGGWSLGSWSGGGVNIFVYEVNSSKLVKELQSSYSARHERMSHVPVKLNVYSTRFGEPKKIYANYTYN